MTSRSHLALEIAACVAQLDQLLELAHLLQPDQGLGDVHLRSDRDRGEQGHFTKAILGMVGAILGPV